MRYPIKLKTCPFCGSADDMEFNQPFFCALPICSIVGNLRIGLAIDINKNAITYIGLDTQNGSRIIIKEFFAQGYMFRRDDLTLAAVDTVYNDIINQEKETFCRSAKKYICANQTIYSFRKIWNKCVKWNNKIQISDKVALRSIVGKRSTQEDSAEVIAYDNGIFAVLCDGMGGIRAGETASFECVRKMKEISDTVYCCDEGVIPAVLRRKVVETDKYIASLCDMDEKRLKCGTTLICAVIRGGHMFFSSVGDSHLYLIRGCTVQLLTEEHNYLSELMKMVVKGTMDYDEAINNSKRDALTSYVGIGSVEKIQSPSAPICLEEGDIVLMCSDGLYRSLSDEETLHIIFQHNSINEAADALISEVERKNLIKQDNTTLILYKYSQK